jgi:hypothetical protein
MYAVSVVGTPIQFVEIYGVMPCDDAEETVGGGRPDPNRVAVSLEGNQLHIASDLPSEIYVEVIDRKSGVVVVSNTFVAQTTLSVPQSGRYYLNVYVDNHVFVGRFDL